MTAPEEPLIATWQARPSQHAGTVIVVMGRRIEPFQPSAFGARLYDIVESIGADRVVCDVGALVDPDAAALDALCRMRLTALRLGCQLRLRGASTALEELLDLVGLTDILPVRAGSRLRPKRQPEQREHPRGVEEERDPADPPI